MSLKEVFAPHLNRNVKFGRTLPRPTGLHLRLGEYLKADFPEVPTSYDESTPALPCLTNVEQNDILGDCVIAAKTHIDGVWTGNAGHLVCATPAEVLLQYEKIGGYVLGDASTDNGCNLQDALTWWSKNAGPTSTKLSAYLVLDATNIPEMKAASWLFGVMMLGMALPDKWISPFPSSNGFVWDVAGNADPSNGHCVMTCGYDTTGAYVWSWGLKGKITWKAIAEYCLAKNGGEIYALISTDMLLKASQKAPNGVSWANLVTDWDRLFGGGLPIPAPAPVAPPTPAPPPSGSSVTLAQATAWADAALDTGLPLLTKASAKTLVNSALSKNWPK